MVVVQKWRRVALIVSVLLILDALVMTFHGCPSVSASMVALVQSLFAFIAAVVIAVNFLTFRLRK